MEIQTNVLSPDGTITVESVNVVVSSTTDEAGNPVTILQMESAAPVEDPAPTE